MTDMRALLDILKEEPMAGPVRRNPNDDSEQLQELIRLKSLGEAGHYTDVTDLPEAALRNLIRGKNAGFAHKG